MIRVKMISLPGSCHMGEQPAFASQDIGRGVFLLHQSAEDSK